MNLAVTLLVVLGIASIIGTVLQQNQPYTDYEIKFGRFWFEVFEKVGLFDVYSATWFLLILLFLIVSTSICVLRNAPTFIKDMRNFRENAQLKSLKTFKHQASLDVPDTDFERIKIYLGSRGFGFKENGDLLAVKRGGAHRLGYIFAHIGMIVILIGGLLDSRLHLKLQAVLDLIEIETRNVPVSQINPKSIIAHDNHTYRGSINITEGQSAGVLFLGAGEGYFTQKLPFRIALHDFRVEHHDTGQPKSFESDISILDDNNPNAPKDVTISVNHPLIYQGNAIYQSSFSDGGSELKVMSWQLAGKVGATQIRDVKVYQDYPFEVSGEVYTLEVDDFRLFNINDIEQEDGRIDKINFGPSITYKLRDATGQAREFNNFMSPVAQDGKLAFLTGMRETPSEPFRYVYMPADKNRKVETFLKLYATLNSTSQVDEMAHEATTTLAMSDEQKKQFAASMSKLLDTFINKGLQGVGKVIEDTVPQHDQERVFGAYLDIINSFISTAYGDVTQVTKFSDEDIDFLTRSFDAINALSLYGAPIYLQMISFKQIQQSGLQITKSPGKFVVYLGSIMLIIGVFMMFYIKALRLWIVRDEQTWLIAAQAHRDNADFAQQFDTLVDDITQKLNQTN